MNPNSHLLGDGNEGNIKKELLKIYSDVPNPGQEDLQKFINKINEMESIVIASEFTNATAILEK